MSERPLNGLPRVYPILDGAALERAGIDWISAAESLLEGGAEILQFRHKAFWSREVVESAARVAAICAAAGVPFVVNDRADYAAYIFAEGGRAAKIGLHLGQDDLEPGDARKVIGGEIFIGYSTHNETQMRAAEHEPVDYVAFGPVFGTRSKERPDPAVGLAGLRAARALTARPLVAIGGITRDNAYHCFEAGADSVAVIADMIPQPCTRKNLRERMIEWRQLNSR